MLSLRINSFFSVYKTGDQFVKLPQKAQGRFAALVFLLQNFFNLFFCLFFQQDPVTASHFSARKHKFFHAPLQGGRFGEIFGGKGRISEHPPFIALVVLLNGKKAEARRKGENVRTLRQKFLQCGRKQPRLAHNLCARIFRKKLCKELFLKRITERIKRDKEKEELAKLWEKAVQMFDETERLNMDKKQVLQQLVYNLSKISEG